jgi:hypothetical protein
VDPEGAFCEHRRVRTLCPDCRPRAEHAAPAVELPSGRPAAPPGAPADARDEPARRGPGKPLLPQRRRKRRATRDEAERAEAWWVRKG